MVRKFVLLGLLIAPLAVAGCSTSDDDDGIAPPAGCNADSTLSCAGNATGFACDIGSNPEDEDTSLSCSTPALASGEDDYCCYTGFTGTSSTCTPDDSLTAQCPDPTSYGYSCAANDNPATYDSSLNCSSPTADGANDDFCCTLGGGGGGGGGGGDLPAGCTADDSLSCSGGATGYACAIASNPEDEDSSLSCSTPALASGEDDYCCYTGFTGTDSTCTPDDGLTAVCADPDSYGYRCAANDNPVTYDSHLNCSDPTADGSDDDFCCTYQ